MLVHQSSTRRKACASCVQAKRRCDLRLPQCTRCMNRNLVCEYTTPPESTAETWKQIADQDLIKTSPSLDILPAQDTISVCPLTGPNFEIGASTNSELLSINHFSFPERMTIRQDQIDFCIHQFKDFIPQLVQQNRSPFIHHDSYQYMPPVVYQDLLGVSAMYCQKSPQNQTMIFSMLDSRTSSLIESSKSSTWSAKEYLVGIQAMIIYQIIRLFDGDIRQRANAEKHLGILDIWTMHLHSTSHIYYNDCDTESLYQRWVFIESARRTVLMSKMVQAMYTLLRDGFCDSIPMLGTLPVSINGALWSASEEAWWQNTLGFEEDLLQYQDFTNKWGGGQAFYLDTYETILLIACKHNLRRPSPVPM